MATGPEALQIDIIAQRLATVEKEVAQLKKFVYPSVADESTPWYLKHAGKFENDPDFDEIVQLGREIRESDRLE
ncbi:MAG: hypothetical protein ETSY1_31360 [Candidatus Entotheonella factor]|uniref:Uncharacterized protein n=1 Tax=Entotheonella factor TaxID=1429438 RepID=W4LAZ7_ENTF1|nr:MAG: hypothetical protein ETSY1_31360 [Candidatus Entotheonella factor]